MLVLDKGAIPLIEQTRNDWLIYHVPDGEPERPQWDHPQISIKFHTDLYNVDIQVP